MKYIVEHGFRREREVIAAYGHAVSIFVKTLSDISPARNEK